MMKKLIITLTLLLACCEMADAQLIVASRGVTTQHRKEREKTPKDEFVKDNKIGTWEQYLGIPISISFTETWLNLNYSALYRLTPILSAGGGGGFLLNYEKPLPELYGTIHANLFTKTLSRSRFSPYVGINTGLGWFPDDYSYEDWGMDGKPEDKYDLINDYVPRFAIRVSPKIGFDVALTNKFGIYAALSKDWYLFNKHLVYTYNEFWTLYFGIKF